MSECPLARVDDLVTEPLDDELLVFDERVNRAHSLNASAAAVWRACDGRRTREQLAAECGLDLLAVELALDSLADCDLLVDFAPSGERVSRRAVLRRVAVTGAAMGVALPVIRSIAAPSAQAAVTSGTGPSNCLPGSYCNSTHSCQSGSCRSGLTTKSCDQHPCCSTSTCHPMNEISDVMAKASCAPSEGPAVRRSR